MSFYSDMAAMAAEMLAEFGTDIAITRIAHNFDPVANQPVSGGSQVLVVKGVFTAINKSLVDGTRISESERVVLIGPGIEPKTGDFLGMAQSVQAVGGAPGVVLAAGAALPWTIKHIRAINPAGTPICYFVQVQQ